MNHKSKKIKLAIITNMLAPYRIPLFEIINSNPCIELHVFVMDLLSEERQAWHIKEFTFPCVILEKKKISIHGSRIELPLNLIQVLERFIPDVIVSTGYSISTIVALIYSRFRRIPCHIWSAETILSYKMTRISPAQDYLRKLMIRYSSEFLAYGPDAKEYLLSFGVDEKKVHVINNICDAEPFLNMKKGSKRQDFATIIYVGALTKKKNVLMLIQAYEEISNRYPHVILRLIGDGPLRVELEDFRKKRNLKNLIIQGEVPSTEIPKILSESDFLILPSIYDLWPHVILEAMASGLPVLCSDSAGIPPYIVREGENGYFFNPNTTEDIIQAIEKMLNNRHIWDQMGQRSVALAMEHSIDESANLFIDTIMTSIQPC